MELWIYFTVLAALMQAIRTAAQKHLSKQLNAMATTLARFLYALPLVWIYLFSISFIQQKTISSVNAAFVQAALLAAVSQIAGTAFVIMAFRFQNFAVATSLVKTEAVLTAIMGVLFFDAVLSGFAWLAIGFGVMGVLVLSKTDAGMKTIFMGPASLYGLAAGLSFVLATLWIREASLALNSNLILSAAFTLAVLVSIQTVLGLIFVFLQDKKQLILMFTHWKIAAFVGVASMIGSVGWFTAASFQDAAYVKALGQIEFLFTLFITYRVFKERINLREMIGMLLIVCSVLILLIMA